MHLCKVIGGRRMVVDKQDIRIGIAGWSYEDWKNVVYGRSERNPLRFLSEYFDSIEINTSFYRPIEPGHAHKWISDVARNDRFEFTVKIWRRLTHEEEPYGIEHAAIFKEGLKFLVKTRRLSALLFQFPFYFRDTAPARDRLKKLADDFSEYPKVIEIRDSSWAEDEALAFLRNLGFSVARLDMPLAKNSFSGEGIDTSDVGYLRLHGRNYDTWFKKGAGRDEKYNYLYNDEEIDELVGRIERIRKIAKKLIVIANNHYIGQAAVNSLQIINRILGTPVAVPPLLLKKYPQLTAIAKPDKGELF